MKKINLILLISFTFWSTFGQNITLDWAKSIGGHEDDRGASLAIDSEGNTYITGNFEGIADFDPNAGEFFLTSNGQDDIYVQKIGYEWQS